MAIPQSAADLGKTEDRFSALHNLRDQINQSLDNSEKLDTLSMGMSNDLEAAISQGSTMVRVWHRYIWQKQTRRLYKGEQQND